MRKHTIPTQANIFQAPKIRKKGRFHFPTMKPVVMIRSAVILAVMLLMSFGVKTVYTNAEITYKQLANSAADSTTNGDTSTAGNPHNDTWSWDNKEYNNNDYKGNYSYTIPPIPEYRYISTDPYQIPPNNNNYSPSDTGGISGQIVSLQQQVGSAMQSCVNNARQGANQLLGMKNQAKRMQESIDSMRDQAWKIHTSTHEGQQRQDTMNRQADQIQEQLDNLNDSIWKAEDRYNSNNGTCRDNVSKLEQSRDDAEGKLDEAFGKAMDISTELPQ